MLKGFCTTDQIKDAGAGLSQKDLDRQAAGFPTWSIALYHTLFV